jgi:hypothetical protein
MTYAAGLSLGLECATGSPTKFNELLRGVPMTTKMIEADQVRIAHEQFDAFERRERLIRTEERAERAVRLNLPVHLSSNLRKFKRNLLLKRGVE